MYVKILRGSKQIGGNIIEIGTKNTHLIFDAGTNLPPLDDKTYVDAFFVDGLTCNKTKYDGVFISHHHQDHCGLIERINDEIPIYCGKETKHIIEIIGKFTNHPITHKLFTFKRTEIIKIGDITVTPILTKHSARDAYMFLIEADGKTVLYSGDFNEFTNTVKLLNNKHPDILITEGTNINCSNKIRSSEVRNESDITAKAEIICNKYKGTVFVLCSSANEDRIKAMEKAAINSGRETYQDLFMSVLRDNDNRKYKFIASYISKNSTQKEYFDKMNKHKELISAKTLAALQRKKLIFIRQSMFPFISKYIKYSKQGNNVLIYSMWNGYKNSNYTKQFLENIKSLGIDIIDLHCSGHAYRDTLQNFINAINPIALIPIHCEEENRVLFNEIHNNCIMLNDGEIYNF